VTLLALTRPVPPSIARCELTHLARQPIDLERAVRQHDAYEEALRALGCRVERLPAAPELPDSVFVEDTAVVLDECAVIARPGAPSRRPEVEAVIEALRARRPLAVVEAPATLDGGDVLRVGRRLLVGRSARSDAAGAARLAAAVAPFGYTVERVPLRGALHLKTAVTALPDDRLLLNPEWVDPADLGGLPWMAVDPSEPFAANVVSVGDAVLCAAAAPRTRERLEGAGYRTVAVDASELAKAEGGLTCGSILLRE
jgi:dimethylargininase